MKRFVYLLLISLLLTSCLFEKKPSQTETFKYYIACSKGNLEFVKEYLNKYPKFVDTELTSNDYDYSYNTFAQYLINEGIAVFSADEEKEKKEFIINYKRRPINIAARYGYLDIVKLLVSYNTDVNFKEENLNTPLLIAVRNNDVEIVKELLKCKPELNERNNEDFTALSLAIYNNNKEIVQELLQSGANTEIYSQSYTPLMIASASNNIEIIQLLLSFNANINTKTIKGQNALQFALLEKNLEATNLLLKNGANVNDRDNEGTTPLMIAVGGTDYNLVKILVNAGANINAKHNSGYNVLDFAILASESNQTGVNIVNYLIDAGAKNAMLVTNTSQNKPKIKKSTNPSDNFKYKLTDDGNGVVITKYIGDDQIVEIPREIEGFPVRQIGQYESIFKDYKKTIFEELVIPDTVVSIKWEAFAKANIKKIVIPDSVRDFDPSALNQIGYLEELKLPEKVDSNLFYIDFSSTCNLKEVVIPISTRPSYYTEISVKKQSKIQKVVFSEGINNVSIVGNISNINEIKLPQTLKCVTGRVLLNPKTKFSIPFSNRKIEFSYWNYDSSGNFSPYMKDNCTLNEQKEILDFWRNLGFTGYFAEESMF